MKQADNIPEDIYRYFVEIARSRGLRFNPDEERVTKLIARMEKYLRESGQFLCPCKQNSDQYPPGTPCPCPDLDREVAADGHCHCRLFFR